MMQREDRLMAKHGRKQKIESAATGGIQRVQAERAGKSESHDHTVTR
jgi:hypothetical protein